MSRTLSIAAMGLKARFLIVWTFLQLTPSLFISVGKRVSCSILLENHWHFSQRRFRGPIMVSLVIEEDDEWR